MERTPHCLIVEDDREISDLVARFLTKHGIRVSVAANRLGYESEAAFSRAFKRVVGHPPGASARRLREKAGAPQGAA